MAKFISLFAGVGGFDHGLHKANHECVAQVEWDKNAAGVLKHRWPNVPLFCDVSKVTADDLPDCDFITYGFPCQDVSQAGLRKGLDGKRSGLFFEACRIIKQLAERAIRRGGAGGGRFIAVAENVKGLQSSGDGYDFARCIRELHNIGASEVGFSVFDSQYFGVAQRRKRVFLVADFGGESTSEILAFSEGVSGHPPPSREAGKGTAGDASESVGEGIQDIAHTLETTCHDYSRADGFNMILQSLNGESATKTKEGFICKECDLEIFSGCGCDHGEIKCDKCGEWTYPFYYDLPDDGCQHCGSELEQNLTVRRLTPIECERLQGFPDNWTSEKMELILEGNEWKATGKVLKQADGPRYKAMGNAVTVNVAEWIGKQIGKVLNETK